MFGLGACVPHYHKLSGQYLGGSDHKSGHILRDGKSYPKATSSLQLETVILGGGVAGLSAAWKLAKSGQTEVHLFELESKAGGNSRAQEYEPCKAPWGAHYLPAPTVESKAVREILEEMNLLDPHGALNERHLCHPLQERLWYQGRWHESLLPMEFLDPTEKEQWADFRNVVKEFMDYRDDSGRKAFAIPLALSSTEPHLLELDQVSFGTYVRARGWTSPYLTWILDYACRDDYGAGMDQVSAWAGLHYFCARDGGGFPQDDALFVWPEGNAKLVEHLKSKLHNPVTTSHLVLNVTPGNPVTIDLLDLAQNKPVRVEARNCIYALPSFQRKYHLADDVASSFQYKPWVTANLVLRRAPKERSRLSEPAWDNVIYQSESLGYVVAAHQIRAWSNLAQNVWTWYLSFPNQDASTIRKQMLESRWEDWKERILSDLETVHSDIRDVTERIDVALFGHGMISPTPGHIWGKAAEAARQPKENVWFAHSDLSGISVFEEAQYRGVLAAQKLMEARGIPFEDSLLLSNGG